MTASSAAPVQLLCWSRPHLASVGPSALGGRCTPAHRKRLGRACGQSRLKVPRPAEEGFPAGPVVMNPPPSVGDTGPLPGLGGSRLSRSNLARAPRLPCLSSGARELQRQARGPRSGCSATEAMRGKEGAAPARGNGSKACAATKTPHGQKEKT